VVTSFQEQEYNEKVFSVHRSSILVGAGLPLDILSKAEPMDI
jgi:hypothetical protein